MVAPSYLQLLRKNRQFRWLWLGQVVSFFGDWFKTIALYTIVQELTDSAQALAAVLVFGLLPIFLMTPIAGPMADRFDRRKLMIGADIARAASVLGLIAAHHLGSLLLLFSTQFVMVCFSGLFIPARSASIPQLTSDDELPVAMALSGGTWSVMLAVGAAVGGLVTAAAGVDTSLLLDGATFLLSAVFLTQLPPLLPAAREAGESTSFRDGLRYLAGDRYLTAVLSLKPAIGMATAAVAMIPLYGGGLFPAAAGPAFIGGLYAARGTGALIGTMGLRRLLGDDLRAFRRAIPVGFLVTSLAYVGLASADSIITAGLFYLMGTLGTGMIWVFAGILGQRHAAPSHRGRVFSLEFGVMTLLSALSSWLAGAMVDWTSAGPREVVAVVAVVMLLPAVGWLVAMARFSPDR